MNLKLALCSLLLILSVNVAQAAGEPLNQDFTELKAALSKTIEAGKQGNSSEFMVSLDNAFEIVKDQKLNGDSPKLHRTGVKLKAAKKQGKDGELPDATSSVEEALSIVQ